MSVGVVVAAAAVSEDACCEGGDVTVTETGDPFILDLGGRGGGTAGEPVTILESADVGVGVGVASESVCSLCDGCVAQLTLGGN